MSRSSSEKISGPALVPGIDMEQRTVQLAADVETALDREPGLTAFFYSLSFSHKKEYAVYVETAGKPETRLRRIGKITAMLLALQAKNKK